MQQADPFEPFVIKAKEYNANCLKQFESVKEKYDTKEKTIDQMLTLSLSDNSPFNEEALIIIDNYSTIIYEIDIVSDVIYGDVTPETELTFNLYKCVCNFGSVKITYAEFLRWVPDAEMRSIKTVSPVKTVFYRMMIQID